MEGKNELVKRIMQEKIESGKDKWMTEVYKEKWDWEESQYKKQCQRIKGQN